MNTINQFYVNYDAQSSTPMWNHADQYIYCEKAKKENKKHNFLAHLLHR